MTGLHGPPISRRTALSVALVGAAAAACGTTQAPAGQVDLYSDNPTWDEGLVTVNAPLRRVSGYGFDTQAVPSTTSYQQVVQSSLLTHKTPDIAKWWSGYRIQDIARTGGIVDISPLWDTLERRGWVDPVLRDAFSLRGRAYGLPMNEAYWVMFYNPKVFRSHGVTPPATWDEMIATAMTFKRRGVTPFYASVGGGWPAFIWFQEIVSKLDPVFYQRLTSGQASYTDPEAVAAARIWKSLIDAKLFTPLDMAETQAADALKRGELAMLPYGTWGSQTFVQFGMKPTVDFDAFIVPPIHPRTRRSVIFETSALLIPKRASKRDAALQTLGGWLNPAVARPWADWLQDGSPNPAVPAANAMLERLRREVKGQHMMQLNRYWEASPPDLVENTIEYMASIMLEPASYMTQLRKMEQTARSQWAVWREDA